MAIHVVVAGTDLLVSEGLALALSQRAGLAACVAGSAEAAMERCRQLAPCVLLADEAFLETTDAHRRLWRAAGKRILPVLVLGPDSKPDAVLYWLRQGCMGYLSRQDDLVAVRKAILAVTAGQIWAPRALVARVLQELLAPEERGPRLTAREEEILPLIAAGLDNARVADMLYISVETVRWHLRRLFVKIGVRDRAGAVEFALRQGLVRRAPEPPALVAARVPVQKAYWNQSPQASGIPHQFLREIVAKNHLA